MGMGCEDLCSRGWIADVSVGAGAGAGVRVAIGDIEYKGVKDERNCRGFLMFFHRAYLKDLSSNHLFGNEYFSKKHITEHYMEYANISHHQLFNQ